MKKKTFMGVMALIAAMLLSVSGTCFAQDTVFIDQTRSGTTRIFYGPVFSTSADGNRNLDTGATAFGIVGGGTPYGYPTMGAGRVVGMGATPFAIADLIRDAAGEMNLVFMPDATWPYWSGSTPVGSPVVISGETNAFVVAVRAGTQVENGWRAGNANIGAGGVTVVMIDGATMTINWDFGIPEDYGLSAVSLYPSPTFAGVSAWFPTQLTVWTPNSTDPRIPGGLDVTGATIYGTSGATTSPPAGATANTTGASVWALTNWGAPITGGGTTVWTNDPADYTGAGSHNNYLVRNTMSVGAVSGFLCSPVISGESIFYIGGAVVGAAGVESAGATIYQFDKDEIGTQVNGALAGYTPATPGGVIYAATINAGGVAQTVSDRFTPTPVTLRNTFAPAGTSGVSLVVVGNQGGVTIYDTADLAFGGVRTVGQLGANGAGTAGSFLLPAGVFTGVTASPVVYEFDNEGDYFNDPWIIFCGTSAVTCYQASNGLATNSRAWWFDFARFLGAGAQIWGTPAVSNGFVYVPVVNGANGTIFVFDIDATPGLPNGELQWVARHDLNSPLYSSPIVVNTQVWGIGSGLLQVTSADAYRFDEAGTGRALANPFWTQYKFDAAKKGQNTLVDDDDFFPSDGGCFISTVK